MPELDPVIHQPVRLQIMAALSHLAPREQVDFTYLKTKLALTDGNLGAHLATIEQAGYITFVALTAAGRRAFAEHVAALTLILHPQHRS
jgi:DNA-binding MarR family transcriptional regulator